MVVWSEYKFNLSHVTCDNTSWPLTTTNPLTQMFVLHICSTNLLTTLCLYVHIYYWHCAALFSVYFSWHWRCNISLQPRRACLIVDIASLACFILLQCSWEVPVMSYFFCYFPLNFQYLKSVFCSQGEHWMLLTLF